MAPGSVARCGLPRVGRAVLVRLDIQPGFEGSHPNAPQAAAVLAAAGRLPPKARSGSRTCRRTMRRTRSSSGRPRSG